jgi:hypothetical protein
MLALNLCTLEVVKVDFQLLPSRKEYLVNLLGTTGEQRKRTFVMKGKIEQVEKVQITVLFANR